MCFTWGYTRLLIAGSMGAVALVASGAQEPSGHDQHYAHCAKICAECMNRCEDNFHHCAKLVAAGKKEHGRSMHLSLDCAELCATAARLSARKSELAVAACHACAKACDVCAAECEKNGDNKMIDCAKVCRDCARACRDMIKLVENRVSANND